MGSLAVECAACGARLAGPLVRLDAMPVPRAHDDGIGYDPTMPRGHAAVDPRPRATYPDGRPASSLGCLVIHPADAPDLGVHPDWVRSSGCCGNDGLDGPNRVCPGCGAEVATLVDDCWTRVELRFEAGTTRWVGA